MKNIIQKLHVNELELFFLFCFIHFLCQILGSTIAIIIYVILDYYRIQIKSYKISHYATSINYIFFYISVFLCVYVVYKDYDLEINYRVHFISLAGIFYLILYFFDTVFYYELGGWDSEILILMSFLSVAFFYAIIRRENKIKISRSISLCLSLFPGYIFLFSSILLVGLTPLRL